VAAPQWREKQEEGGTFTYDVECDDGERETFVLPADIRLRPLPPAAAAAADAEGGSTSPLTDAARAAAAAAAAPPAFVEGQVVEADVEGGGEWRKGRVTGVHEDGLVEVEYDDGDDPDPAAGDQTEANTRANASSSAGSRDPAAAAADTAAAAVAKAPAAKAAAKAAAMEGALALPLAQPCAAIGLWPAAFRKSTQVSRCRCKLQVQAAGASLLQRGTPVVVCCVGVESTEVAWVGG
jgi:hypothetical protein